VYGFTRNLSEDLQYLYGSRNKFYNEQYDESVLLFGCGKRVLKKNKKIMISYQGAIQFGRNGNSF
jgi:hypothetical protein